MIGRIPVINLNAHQSELFHLRMLLHHVPGPKSFVDVHTIDGTVHSTYQAACKALGLLEDETEIDRIMEEAGSIRFGSSLREVFALILIIIRPSDPVRFLEEHKKLLFEYLMHQQKVTELNDAIVNEGIMRIQIVLHQHGLDLEKDFKLPKPDPAMLLLNTGIPNDIRDETSYNVDQLQCFLSDSVPNLNEEQADFYHAVVESDDNKPSTLFALDTPGGTGKTHVLSILLAKVRSQKKVALATATSGTAATLLPNGRTLHSSCKVPLSVDDKSTCSITKRASTGLSSHRH